MLDGLVGGKPTARSAPRQSGDVLFRTLDASMGVEGLPQSATGQTALLTGVNGAALMGRHYGPWPGPTLLPLLQRGTLFHDAQRLQGAVLANAYPDDYFAAMDTRRFRPNAPVVAARSAGVELRGMQRYQQEQAVAADLSGARFAAHDARAGARTPARAAAVLAQVAATASLTFFDLWLTDTYGHARDLQAGVQLIERVDTLLGALLAAGAGSAFTLLLTSDHGNLEDLSTKSHTYNRVPLLVIGAGARQFAAAASLLDVAPGIRRFWAA